VPPGLHAIPGGWTPGGKEPRCMVKGTLGSGRRADPHPAQAHPAAGRNPRRPRKPSRCASTGGWSCSGSSPSGSPRRRWAAGEADAAEEPRHGNQTGDASRLHPASPAHQQPSAEHPGLGPGGCSPPGRWHPDLNSADLDAAERIVAERPLHRDRGGRGVHHPRAAPGQHRGRQVRARRTARGRGGRHLGAGEAVTAH
jgi:hypothetical protein